MIGQSFLFILFRTKQHAYNFISQRVIIKKKQFIECTIINIIAITTLCVSDSFNTKFVVNNFNIKYK